MATPTPDFAATNTTAASPADLTNTTAPSPAYQDDDYGKYLVHTGEGEYTMKIFIQEHMTSILHPLAERVTDLQRSVAKIEGHLSHTDEALERNSDQLNLVGSQLATQDSRLARVIEDVHISKKEIGDLINKQVSQENVLDGLGVHIRKVEGLVDANQSFANDLQRSFEEIDGRVRQMQFTLSEQNILHLSFSDRLNELRGFYDSLNDRHLATMKNLQEVKQADENTRNTLKRHIQGYEKQKKDDLRSLQLLDDRTKALEVMLLEVSHKVETQGKTLRSYSLKHEQVLRDIEEAADMGGRRDSQQKLQRTPTEMFSTRIQRVEENIASISRKEVSDMQNLNGRLNDISDQVTKNTSDIERDHCEIDGLAKHFKILDDRMVRVEDKSVIAERTIEHLEKQASQTEQDVRHQGNLHRDLHAHVQLQDIDLEKTKNHLSKTNQDLEFTSTTLSDVRHDLNSAVAAIEKTNSRMELAHEYLQGVSKGFQDAHKRVMIGSDGMIQPKSGQRKMLPEIPGSRSTTPRQ